MDSTSLFRGRAVATAVLIASLIAACGGGGSDTPATPPPPAGNVGPGGATVSSPDNNATLVVPAGAASSPINVALTPATDGFMADPQIVPGTIFKLDAPEQALAQPATLSIAIPDSAFAAANGSRERAQALVTAPGFLGCYSRTFTQGSSYSFFPIQLSARRTCRRLTIRVQARRRCASTTPHSAARPVSCRRNRANRNKPDYFTPQNPDTFPPGSDSGNGPIVVCEVAPLPQPLLALLSSSARRRCFRASTTRS